MAEVFEKENTNEGLKRERNLWVAAATLPLAAQISTYKKICNFSNSKARPPHAA